MSRKKRASWLEIQAELRRRIIDGIWQPGELIPGEQQLAEEFECARATVNRALQGLADAGLLERRRRAGSRVATEPSRYATVKIDIIRLEIERSGADYRHVLTKRKHIAAPKSVQRRMNLRGDARLLHLCTLHLADDQPFIFEERWLNPALLPGVLEIDFHSISANEWLVRNVTFTRGDIEFSAAKLTRQEAEMFEVEEGQAAFVIERTTWQDEECITSVRLLHRPGFSKRVQLI